MHEALEGATRPIGRVGGQAFGRRVEPLLDPRDHRHGGPGLVTAMGACALGIDDDTELVVDQAIGVIGKDRTRLAPRHPGGPRVGQ